MRVYIRERRMEKHMTQKQLRECLIAAGGPNIKQSLFSRYERGEIPVPLETMLWIAAVLGCRVEDLAGRE